MITNVEERDTKSITDWTLCTLNLRLNNLAVRNRAVSSWVISDKPENWIRIRIIELDSMEPYQYTKKEESIYLVFFFFVL